MISRKTSNSRQYVETLQQTSFVGSAGINTKASPTASNTLLDITNFDIEADGSLALRKPLIKHSNTSFHDIKPIVSNYIFNKTYRLNIYRQSDKSVYINLQNEYNENVSLFLKYTDLTGAVSITDNLTALSGVPKDVKIINTVSSTIITGFQINLNTYGLNNPDTYPSDNDVYAYRYLRLYLNENSEWIVEIINPEINEFTSAEAAVLNPNLTLDYAYALRDNYNAASVGVTNILAYAIANTNFIKPSLNPDASFSGYTIEQLTEKITGISPRILNTVNKNITVPVCLKAFINVKSTDDISNYVCIWEKTYNGVDWLEVPEFVDNDCVLVALPDPTVSDETFNTSGTYKSLKKCKIFNPKSNKDLVTKRPDCLILGNLDTATYRFSIYSLKELEKDYFKYSKVYLVIDGESVSEDSKSHIYTFNKQVIDVENVLKTTVTLTFRSSSFNSGLENNFKIRVVYKNEDSETFEQNSLRYNSTSSGGGYISHTLQFTLTLPALNNFYDSKPMLIKVYFKDKVLHTFKVIYNRLQTITYNENLDISHNNDLVYNFTKYDKKDTVDNVNYAHTNPFSINPVYECFLLSDTTTYGQPYVTSLFKVKYSNFTNASGTDNFKYTNLLTKIDIPSVETYTMSHYRETQETISYNLYLHNWYTALVTPTNAIVVFVTPDEYTDHLTSEDSLVLNTMEQYKKIYNSQKHVGLKEIYETVDVSDNRPFDEDYISVQLTLGFQQFTFIFANETEFVYSDIPNTVQGEKLYYKKAIYTYGKEFKNNIFPTYTDSFITPLFNVIDLDTTGSSYVTTLVPWRDYLIAATENTVHLITRDTEGYYTKTVNSFIGIPWEDRKTCKSILNGILFKSGSKVYTLSPNAYSGDDTMLNISEISGPIEGLIPETKYDNFAISTEKAYYLFIPDDTQTVCFKYDFVRKIWTKFVYPVHFVDYKIISVDDIRLFSEDKEFYFEKTLKYLYPDVEHLESIRYGDYLEFTDADIKEYNGDSFVTPIEYRLDSGQKTDNISFTKQFTESKILLATLNERYVFPFSLDINIDGTLRTIHKDANTDGSLWKTSDTSVGAIGMTLTTSNTDNFNIIRQMYVRFSGKGKSIQHILSGVSYFNFKFYMVYYRYRLLNVKQ